jgi:hypothetical protein
MAIATQVVNGETITFDTETRDVSLSKYWVLKTVQNQNIRYDYTISAII